jgi:hypothetical protein
MGSILRPTAKTLIKGGMVFYGETLSEIGEWLPISSPRRAELDQEASGDRQAPAKT